MSVRTKMRIDPAALYVAWQGASGEIDGVPYWVGRGDRLRGDHPFVRLMGSEVFVEAETPQNLWPSVFDAAIAIGEAIAAAAVRPEVPSRIDPATPLRDLMIATDGIIDSAAGPCAKGRIVHRDDPVVQVAGQFFRPLVDTLGR